MIVGLFMTDDQFLILTQSRKYMTHLALLNQISYSVSVELAKVQVSNLKLENTLSAMDIQLVDRLHI